ncbi:cation:proton antiporter family protein [Methylomonas rhizoryzae]|uniref:cation:proton antiporter family protein n=1 Tax=Methylomonas rhizoryzae TaxID=2608981 RepID=UPI00123273FF|nr:cation:proton antiporter family protein [Methylomonas rhizoryzae]
MTELIWVGSAYLIGLIANRLMLPPLVGYLIAGYALHAAGISALQTLNHLADIGIELLLFSVGLKLKPSSLIRREVLAVGGTHLLLTTAVSGLVFLWLDKQVTGGLMLGVSLSFSSTVLAIKELEDSGELTSLHGRDVLSILIFQDLVAIGLLAFADGRQPTPWAAALLFLPLLRPLAHRLFDLTKAAELKLLLGVTLALAGGVLAEQVHISRDIGALLTGVMLASHPNIDELTDKIWGLKEVFLVAFFLQIGLTDLPNAEQARMAAALLLLLPLQGGLFFAFFLAAGLRARTAFVSSLALTTYSEFALITTNAMVNSGLLTAEWRSVISLALAGSLAIAAPLNRFSRPIFQWLEPILGRFERQSGSIHPDKIPETLGVAEWLVMGMGRTGISAYRALSAQEKRVVGFDADPTVIEQLLNEGRRVIYGDAEDSELWLELPLDKVKGVILTLPELELRASAITQLRECGFRGLIGTLCYHFDEQAVLIDLGADFVLHPRIETGNQIVQRMLDADAQ